MVSMKARMERVAPAPADDTRQPSRRLCTVDEYYNLADKGIISRDERLELIEGEILVMRSQNGPHVACTLRINTWFTPRVAGRAIVSVQCTMLIPDYSAPEPDFILLKLRDDFYESGVAQPADVLLLAEVSHSSVAFDRGRKLRMYAAAGIPEYWVFAVERKQLHVYRTPKGRAYAEHLVVKRGETIAPLAFPDLAVPVDQILGLAKWTQ